MTIASTIDAALADPRLLGAAIGDLEPWRAWRTILKAAFGLKLNRSEGRTFAKLAGGRKAPRKRVAELWVIAGRRGGKSRMAAGASTYIATFEDHRAKLAPGETGHVLVLSPSKAQARAVRDYAEGFLEASPILRQEIEGTTTEEIRLAGNVCISVHPNSFRTVRGRTLLACIFDESAFWRDETSALPDVETYRAVLPSLATTGGMLIGISSPYRRLGLLHQKWRDHFGQDDAEVLVIQAPTEALNPTIDKRVIDRARKSDPEAARAEWDAEFRSDISALLDDAAIDAAVDHARPIELPPREGVSYVAFTDASGGRRDHFTVGVGHVEDGIFIADVVRGRAPPFDPNDVAREFASTVREYRCPEIIGDAYGGEWVSSAFGDAGLPYRRAERPKSELYLEALPHFARQAIRIPDHPRLVRELRLLERRTSRSGRDSVDHGPQGHDDYANALAGALHVAVSDRYRPATVVSRRLMGF